ncbi:class I SAM-dependent methyltransferase [Pedobacter immunditicola]|uniref:class I SAM-dependent methyltransferase n=1 Tax=Pedobacter immunditicola TaxID=3133440 RepID=UPI0030AAE15B
MKKFLYNSAFILIIYSYTTICIAQSADSLYTFKEPSRNGTGKVYMGREIAQVMSFDGVAWLERKTRAREENTNLVISKLPIRKYTVVADIGAGSGFYTFRIAPLIPAGKLYAVEIQDDAINYLKDRSKSLKFDHVVVVKGNERSPSLPLRSVDLAIMVDVYHELLYPKEFLKAIRAALKPDGKLLLLEYKLEDAAVNIIPEHKMSVVQVKKELEANGYTLVQLGKFLPLQHFLLFQKK